MLRLWRLLWVHRYPISLVEGDVMLEARLLGLAYQLSLISYYLGLVLYASPLPMSVKRFGLRTAYHGVVSALLVLLYSTLVYAVEGLMLALGFSWSSLFKFYDKMSLTSAAYYASAVGISMFASKVAGLGILKGSMLSLLKAGIQAVVKTLFRASLLLGVSEAAVRVVASLVYNYWQLILALGILLYAIPAGIGRKAGASLIAAAVVLYLALPLLPLWAQLWVSSVSRENIVTGLYAGGGGGEGYIVWGYIDDAIMGVDADVLHVVFWRGGVPLAAESHGVFVMLSPLTPGYYIVSVYLGYREVYRGFVNIPGDCLNETPPVLNIIAALLLLLESIGYSNVKMCAIRIKLSNVVVVGYNLAAYWDPGIRLDDIRADPFQNTFNITLVGNGRVHVCACCDCSRLLVNTTGAATKPVFSKEGSVVCADFSIHGRAGVWAKAVGCEAGFDKVGPRFSPYQPLLTMILHDIPMGAYMVALAYAGAIWSFFALTSLAIYGFGRVLGENPVLVLRVRY